MFSFIQKFWSRPRHCTVIPDSKQCRICLTDENDEQIQNGDDLIHPCHCTGNSHYVHRNCLNTWRSTQKEQFVDYTKCEICNVPYRIRNPLPLWLRVLRHPYFVTIPVVGLGLIVEPHVKQYYLNKNFKVPDDTFVQGFIGRLGCLYTYYGWISSLFYVGKLYLDPFYRLNVQKHVNFCLFLICSIATPHSFPTFILTFICGASLTNLVEKEIMIEWTFLMSKFIKWKYPNDGNIEHEIIENIDE